MDFDFYNRVIQRYIKESEYDDFDEEETELEGDEADLWLKQHEQEKKEKESVKEPEKKQEKPELPISELIKKKAIDLTNKDIKRILLQGTSEQKKKLWKKVDDREHRKWAKMITADNKKTSNWHTGNKEIDSIKRYLMYKTTPEAGNNSYRDLLLKTMHEVKRLHAFRKEIEPEIESFVLNDLLVDVTKNFDVMKALKRAQETGNIDPDKSLDELDEKDLKHIERQYIGSYKKYILNELGNYLHNYGGVEGNVILTFEYRDPETGLLFPLDKKDVIKTPDGEYIKKGTGEPVIVTKDYEKARVTALENNKDNGKDDYVVNAGDQAAFNKWRDIEEDAEEKSGGFKDISTLITNLVRPIAEKYYNKDDEKFWDFFKNLEAEKPKRMYERDGLIKDFMEKYKISKSLATKFIHDERTKFKNILTKLKEKYPHIDISKLNPSLILNTLGDNIFRRTSAEQYNPYRAHHPDYIGKRDQYWGNKEVLPRFDKDGNVIMNRKTEYTFPKKETVKKAKAAINRMINTIVDDGKIPEEKKQALTDIIYKNLEIPVLDKNGLPKMDIDSSGKYMPVKSFKTASTKDEDDNIINTDQVDFKSIARFFKKILKNYYKNDLTDKLKEIIGEDKFGPTGWNDDKMKKLDPDKVLERFLDVYEKDGKLKTSRERTKEVFEKLLDPKFDENGNFKWQKYLENLIKIIKGKYQDDNGNPISDEFNEKLIDLLGSRKFYEGLSEAAIYWLLYEDYLSEQLNLPETGLIDLLKKTHG